VGVAHPHPNPPAPIIAMMPAKLEPSDKVLKKLAYLKDDAKSSNKRVLIEITKVSQTNQIQPLYFDLLTLITTSQFINMFHQCLLLLLEIRDLLSVFLFQVSQF
jgi:hypothetical protein